MFATAVFAVGVDGAAPNEQGDLAGVPEGAAGAAGSTLNLVVPPDGVDDNNGFGASTVGADVEGDGVDCPNVKAGLGAFVPELLRRPPKSKVS